MISGEKGRKSKTPVAALAAIGLIAVLCLFGSGSVQRISGPEDPRAAFLLELPDVPLTINEAVARIPTAELRRIRFLVRNPFAESISPGKIYVSVNGEAGGLGVSPGTRGYLATCDLENQPKLKLHPGKNVVEVSAQDRQGKWYYASYVLLAGGRPLNDPLLATGATIEYTGQDPPEITITEPKGAMRALALSVSIPVRGTVTDFSGLGVSVKINGLPAALSPSRNTRGPVVKKDTAAPGKVFAFEGRAALTARASMVVIEARDGLGSVTRVSISMGGRQAAVSSQFKGRKFAVIVGISRYKYHEGGLNDLGFADADARAMRDFLERPEGGGFAKGDILYLENENATLEAVREGLRRFLPRAGANDLIILFMAGHGSPDPYSQRDLYYLMHDTRVADMPQTALPMTEVQEALDGVVRAKRVVVFVDTCHAAGLSGDRPTRGLENNLINLYATKLFKETGRAVLTSSDVNEPSQESIGWGGGHGIFTLAILDGLRGEADTNGDHFVTAGELFAYVRDRVRRETGFHQNPHALPGLNADLTLAVSTK